MGHTFIITNEIKIITRRRARSSPARQLHDHITPFLRVLADAIDSVGAPDLEDGADFLFPDGTRATREHGETRSVQRPTRVGRRHLIRSLRGKNIELLNSLECQAFAGQLSNENEVHEASLPIKNATTSLIKIKVSGLHFRLQYAIMAV